VCHHHSWLKVTKKTPTPKRRKTTRVVLQDKPVNISRPKTARPRKLSTTRVGIAQDTAIPQEFGTFAFLKHNTTFDPFAAYQTVNPIKLESRGRLKDEQHDVNHCNLRNIPESPLYKMQESLQNFITNDPKLLRFQKNQFENQDHLNVERRHQALGDNPLNMISHHCAPEDSPDGIG
jgi:hypothetical protein